MLPVAKYLLFHANEICRAERRWGELYRQSETAKASGSNQFKETSPPATSPPTLGSMGVTRTQSSNWQALADIPEDEFERRLRGKDPQNCVACSLILTQLSKHEHVWVAATVYRALNEGSEPMRVTFDTNALSDVIAPETSQRGALGAASGKKVRAAIEVDHMQGFFCETLITLEGIKNADRSAVFGSTAVDTTYRHGTAPDGNGVTYIDMRVEQPARKPLDQRQADRFQAAFDLGMKLLLGAPIVGMDHVPDPEGKRYLAEPDKAALVRRLERHWDVVTAIEARGLGWAQAKQLAREIQADIGGDNSFFVYLGKPRNPPEQKKINRAIAEWTDGESVAAHYAYGIDLFCSEDFGKSASPASVLDNDNRAWLTDAFGIQFVTLAQLADMATA